MAGQNGTGASASSSAHTPITPDVFKFALALVLAAIVVRSVEEFSTGAAWALVFLFLGGMFINTPLLWGQAGIASRFLGAK